MVDADGRRLADKLGDAIEHARKFGKQELADRLQEIYDSVQEDDRRYLGNRRTDVPAR